MLLVPPSRWWLIPAIALPGSIACALLPQVLPNPLGIVICVNGLLPLTIVAAACFYPRLWSAFLAGPLALTGFTLTRAAWADHQFWHWRPTWVITQVLHPIVVAAFVIGTGIAFVIVLVVRTRVQVGVELPPGACERCGYDATNSPTCPECGTPNPRAAR